MRIHQREMGRWRGAGATRRVRRGDGLLAAASINERRPFTGAELAASKRLPDCSPPICRRAALELTVIVEATCPAGT
jgi:hypothetical protein